MPKFLVLVGVLIFALAPVPSALAQSGDCTAPAIQTPGQSQTQACYRDGTKVSQQNVCSYNLQRLSLFGSMQLFRPTARLLL